MKIKDGIFRHPNVHRVPAEGLCRLRIFERRDRLRITVLTELHSESPGAAVELCATLIYRALVDQGEISRNTPLIRHVVSTQSVVPVDCAWMSFDREEVPSWRGISVAAAANVLECDEAELTLPTSADAALVAEIRRLRAVIVDGRLEGW
jgi:hypothetical protein